MKAIFTEAITNRIRLAIDNAQVFQWNYFGFIDLNKLSKLNPSSGNVMPTNASVEKIRPTTKR